MRDPAPLSAMTASTSEHHESTSPGNKNMYSMQILLEEVATLRNRVRELEDGGSASDIIHDKADPTDDSSEAEVSSLRKQLARVQSERADLELDFMNQLSVLAREKQESAEEYQTKLAKLEQQGNYVNDESSEPDGRDDVVKQLRDDLASTDKELKVNRHELKDMEERVGTLEYEKLTLIDEITDTRLDFENESKMVASLRSEMDQMECIFDKKVEKLEADVHERDETIRKLTESHGEMNDEVAGLEGQKALLLDEITSLRLMMDRDDKVKAGLRDQIEKQTRGDLSRGETFALQQTIDDLQVELQSATKVYMDDVVRLEEMIATRDAKVDQSKKVVLEKERALFGSQEQIASMERDVKALKKQLEAQKKLVADKEAELSSIRSQRSSKSAIPAFVPASPMRQRAPATPPATPPRPVARQNAHRAPSPVSERSPQTKVGGLVAQFERNISASSSFDEQSASFPELRVDTTTEPSHTIPGPPSLPHQSDPTAREVDDLKQQLEGKCKEVKVLTDKLVEQSETVRELRASVAAAPATRAALQTAASKESQKEISALQANLRETKRKLEKESKQVEQLKIEIVQLTSERVHYEEKAMDTYEKRSVGLRKSNDAEVNRLKVELTKSQVSKGEMEHDYKIRIKELEEDIDGINAEVELELQEKQRELDDIQRQLEEQREQVTRLQTEREQLCMSMNSMSNSRKDELDDLQAELMEKTAMAAEYQRELQSMKMHIDAQGDSKAELEQLKLKVRELETNERSSTMAHISRIEGEDLRNENTELRASVRHLTHERRAQQEKLSALLADKTSAKSMKVLSTRNEALTKEVERLNRKLKQVESTITRVAL